MTSTIVARRTEPQTDPPRPGLWMAVTRSEWTKLRTVRSTMWSLMVTVLITVGLGALFCFARVSRWDRLDAGERLHFDPTGFSLNGVFLAQLAIGVLGVLVMSSEYATGQIRATFGAVPQRRTVLAAKVAVFTVVAFVVGLVACGAAFGIGQVIFQSKRAGASITDPTVLRAVVGGALYLAVMGAFGVGLATVVRRTAGAIATLVGLMLVLPILVNFLPSPWNDDIGKYLPNQAGGAIFQVIPRSANTLAPWVGIAVFAAYAAISLIAGAILLTTRDA
jgi:ABC-2 type transport system permease protein